MRTISTLCAVLLAGCMCLAQVAAPSQTRPAVPPPAAPATGAPAADPLLLQLTQLGHEADVNLSGLEINRWKADGDSKRQAQSNAESVQRNLREALPTMILAAQAAPGSLGPQFKLYRNLNALYDVMAGLTESAGAFGKKEDYQALAKDTQRLDGIRRQLADRLESMTAQRDNELARIRQAQQQAAAAAAQPPKKIVVDDNEPKPKKKATRKTTKPAAPVEQPK